MANTAMNSQYNNQDSDISLNFENEICIEYENLGDEDLTSAIVLRDAASNKDYDNKSKKSINRKAVQNYLEAIEHYQKCVVFADENKELITDNDSRSQLEKTHNNGFLQRKTKEKGINILEFKDIQDLKNTVYKKPEENSEYNAIRYSEQNINIEQVNMVIAIAGKAKENLSELKKKRFIRLPDGNIFVFQVDTL